MFNWFRLRGMKGNRVNKAVYKRYTQRATMLFMLCKGLRESGDNSMLLDTCSLALRECEEQIAKFKRIDSNL